MFPTFLLQPPPSTLSLWVDVALNIISRLIPDGQRAPNKYSLRLREPVRTIRCSAGNATLDTEEEKETTTTCLDWMTTNRKRRNWTGRRRTRVMRWPAFQSLHNLPSMSRNLYGTAFLSPMEIYIPFANRHICIHLTPSYEYYWMCACLPLCIRLILLNLPWWTSGDIVVGLLAYTWAWHWIFVA